MFTFRGGHQTLASALRLLPPVFRTGNERHFPPQAGQVSISIPKTCPKRLAEVGAARAIKVSALRRF